MQVLSLVLWTIDSGITFAAPAERSLTHPSIEAQANPALSEEDVVCLCLICGHFHVVQAIVEIHRHSSFTQSIGT